MFGSRSAIPVRRALPPLHVELEELREPGHVPTPPRPQTGFACGRLSPEAGRKLFGMQKIRVVIEVRPQSIALLRYSRLAEFAERLELARPVLRKQAGRHFAVKRRERPIAYTRDKSVLYGIDVAYST